MKLRRLKIQKKCRIENIQFLKYKYIYSFKQFEVIRSLAENIFDGKLTLNNADEDQRNLLIEIVNFKKDGKARDLKEKNKKGFKLMKV